MKHRIFTITGAVAAAFILCSCATSEIKSGEESLVVRILPQGAWPTSKIYLNNQYIDTAVPGADQRVFKVAPGHYRIRLVTDNHTTCEETVTIVGGMGGKNYFEFHPKQLSK